MGLAPSKYPPKNKNVRPSFKKYVIWDIKVQNNGVIWGMNGTAMARHGLILRESEATGSRKVSKYLPGLRDTIFGPKMIPKSKILEHLFRFLEHRTPNSNTEQPEHRSETALEFAK